MLTDAQSRTLTSFSGPWLLPEAYRVPGQNALLARNVRYISTPAGSDVATRLGHSIVWTPNDGAVSALYNWLHLNSGQKNILLYYIPAIGVRYADLSNPAGTLATVISQTGAYAASFANGGSRVFAAFFNSAGLGAYAGQVYSEGVGADTLFAPPAVAVPTITEPGAGSVTAGTHRIGYLLNTRNGYTTKPCPAPADVFAPVSWTSAGSKNLNAQFTATFPAYAASVQMIMTTAANLNKWYLVPGATVAVVPGAPFTVNCTWDISDDDLEATGTDATPYFNRLSATVGGVAPFKPAVVFLYGSRMAYITIDAAGFPVCYFSDVNDYQTLYAATSGVYLPGNLAITNGFQLRGVCYLTGPHWTYATSDDGNKPTQWATPQLVDGGIGTLSARGVCVNAAQGFAWVADESGLYLFQGGQYPTRPVSYYQQPDWARINWAAAQAVQVADDKLNKRVTVLAPLDGATSPTHQLTWDYTNGTEPETVQYSLDDISGYSAGAIALVQNDATKHQEVWLAPSAAGSIIRANDGTEANPYRDIAAGINAVYETALSPGLAAPRGVKFHHGARLRVRGNGNLALVVYGLDHVRSVVPARSPIVLSAAPGVELLAKWFLQSEQASIQLSANAADSWFVLSMLEHFWTPASPQR